jgi:hypothetical protein
MGISMYHKSHLQQLKRLTIACALVSLGVFSVSLQVYKAADNSISLLALAANSDTSDNLSQACAITKISADTVVVNDNHDRIDQDRFLLGHFVNHHYPGVFFSAWKSLCFT